MHDESRAYISQWSTDEQISVVELGSRHTWGEPIRGLFKNANYHGIDAQHGDGVDEVANASTWQPPNPVDLVVCSEVFEHTPRWREIVANSFHMLTVGGRAVFTCAGPGRAIHGVGTDSPDDRDYYVNVSPHELFEAMKSAGFVEVKAGNVPHRSTPLSGTDTQATGVRP